MDELGLSAGRADARVAGMAELPDGLASALTGADGSGRQVAGVDQRVGCVQRNTSLWMASLSRRVCIRARHKRHQGGAGAA